MLTAHAALGSHRAWRVRWRSSRRPCTSSSTCSPKAPPAPPRTSSHLTLTLPLTTTQKLQPSFVVAHRTLLSATTTVLLGATRAASRLAAVQFTDDSSHHSAAPFVVPPDRVRLVACAGGASEFAAAMAALAACRDGDGRCGTLAIDAEWRPDVGASCHLPSLVQAATLCTPCHPALLGCSPHAGGQRRGQRRRLR